MADVLKLGIAGANAERGWAYTAHLGAIRSLPALAIHAVSARTGDLAEKAAAHFGAARSYSDSLEMVRDPDIDIVAVTVKVPEHKAIVLAALEAGKHVYCEWPLGRDVEETELMAKAARNAGVHAAIGLQGANSAAIRQAADAVRSGAIGKPMHLRVVSGTGGWGATVPAFYAYLQDARNGATLSTITGGHTLAAVERIVGPFAEILAQESILRDKVRIAGTGDMIDRSCADHLSIIGLHDNGCVSTIEIAGGVHDRKFALELTGTDGTLSVSSDQPGDYQLGKLTVQSTAALPACPVSGAPGPEGPSANVAELWRTFVDDIQTGSRTVPDFDTALDLARLLATIGRSSREGRRLRVGE